MSLNNIPEVQNYESAEIYYLRATISETAESIRKRIDRHNSLEQYEEAFLLIYQHNLIVPTAERINIVEAANNLSYPISNKNKEKIYSVLETVEFPLHKELRTQMLHDLIWRQSVINLAKVMTK